MRDFLEYLLVDLKFFSITVLDVILLVFIVAFTIAGVKLSRKLIYTPLSKLLKNDKLTKLIHYIIEIVLLTIAFSISLSIILVDFDKIIILTNKFFEINLQKLLISLATIIIAIVFQKFLNYFLKDIKKQVKTLTILSVFTWILAFMLILKTILTDFEAFTSATIIKIKEVPVSISDILYVFLLIGITIIVIIGVNKFLKLQTKKGRLEIGTSSALFNVFKYAIWIISILLSLQGVGFNLTVLLAGSAALLVGLGMGIQQLFGDIAAGFVLLIERTLKVSDIIEVDNIVGKVVKSGIRTTTILSRDNVRIIVPNSKFTTDNVINWSHIEAHTRFNVNVGVAYGSDVQLVIELLKATADNHKDIISEPKPFVRFQNFGDSSLDFKVFFWTIESFRVDDIKSDLRIEIDKKFRENKISIPFPQRDIHIIRN